MLFPPVLIAKQQTIPNQINHRALVDFHGENRIAPLLHWLYRAAFDSS